MNMRTTSIMAISAAFTCLAAAACSSPKFNNTPIAASSPAPTAASASPARLTEAQSAQICQDIQAWILGADNQDMPRFSTTLQTDEAQARGMALGYDMTSLDNDLQSENTDALLPTPPGQPSDISSLSQDCNAYGVTLNWNPES